MPSLAHRDDLHRLPMMSCARTARLYASAVEILDATEDERSVIYRINPDPTEKGF